MSIELKAADFQFEVSVAGIEELRLHEKVIESYLKELAESIEEDGMVKDPVIVDEVTGIVLDGMHRVSAIEFLGYDKIPVCLVDYHDSRVKVGSWSRIFRGLPLQELLGFCERIGFEIESCTPEGIEEILVERESEIMIVSSEEDCYSLSRGSESMNDIYDSVAEIEEALRKRGVEFRYDTEKDILERMKSDEIAVLIPIPRKGEIIDTALSDSVFYHKVSRHVVPARPMRVDFPLEFLEMELSEADEKLTDHLKSREIERLPSGSWFRGRLYEEELLVFNF